MTGPGSVMLVAWIGAVTGLPIALTAWALIRRSGRLRLAWAAAGLLLVTEAGGKVTDLDGADYSVERGDILAANLELHPQILEKLQAAQ